jgi:hypothetical protein
MPLFQAIAKPESVEKAILLVEWASGLMMNLQPSSIPSAQPTPIDIEPPGRAIDLDPDTILGASRQHAPEIQVIA